MARFINLDSIRAKVRARQLFSWQELLILEACREEHRKVAWLANDLGIPKPSVTRSIDNMEAQGLLRRNDDARDLRSPWIELTPAGRKFLGSFVVGG